MMLSNLKIHIPVMAILTTILLSGCGKTDSSEESAPDKFENVDLVASKSYAQSYTYIFKIKSNIDEIPVQELKSMSETLVRRTIDKNALRNPNIVIYIFENDQVVPDVSGYFSDHFDLTNHIYEGDHGEWAYIYMHPVIGKPTWVSCDGGDSGLCR